MTVIENLPLPRALNETGGGADPGGFGGPETMLMRVNPFLHFYLQKTS